MAIITGLSASRYYVNNPIWIDFDANGDTINSGNYINVIVSSNNELLFNSRYYLYEDKVSFDLAEIIKGFLPEPNHPADFFSTSTPPLPYRNFTVSINSITFNRTFFYGGYSSDQTNISIPNNAVFKESEKIPIWSGYPSGKYYLGGDGIPTFTSVILPEEREQQPVQTCNAVYLRFLNSKCGYSFWLFNEWDITKKTTTTDIIDRRGNDLDLGLRATHELTVGSRVGEKYTNTLKALLQSPDVYIYNISDSFENNSAKTWTKIYNAGGTMNWNSYDSVNEFTFKFDMRFKNNPTLIW